MYDIVVAEVTVLDIHGESLVAAHWHPVGTVTVTVPLPPPAFTNA
jgi:hypothetical protein